MEILKKILEVSLTELTQLDTSIYVERYSKELNHDTYYYGLNPGKEHYRLLMYISTLYNDDILFDIGTNRCMSSMALSHNLNNKVKSYDIVQQLEVNPTIPNVEFILGDSTLDVDLHKSPFIFLDVDHDGLYEEKFYNHLRSINWKGLLMLDDIHLNEPMRDFWNSITEEKYDISNIGHWSGTGIVLFS